MNILRLVKVFRTGILLRGPGALFGCLLLAGIQGCSIIKEKSIYPDSTSLLNTPPAVDVVEQSIELTINAPPDVVWQSLLAVLHQYAFIAQSDGGSDTRTLSYFDVSTLLLEDKPTWVSMPFVVTVEPQGTGVSSIRVLCRWDLIADETYQNSKPQRFEDLREGMGTDAILLTSRVRTQSMARDQWIWLGEEDTKNEATQ